MTIGTSVISDVRSTQKDTVRGMLNILGLYLEPIAEHPEKCKITYIAQADMKGSLPSFLMNMFAKEQGQLPYVLNDYLRKFHE